MNTLNLTPEQHKELVTRLLMGNYEDRELVNLIRYHLISEEDLEYLLARGWGILEVVRGSFPVSKIEEEAMEEARRVSQMFHLWNEELGAMVFGEMGPLGGSEIR